MRNKKLLPSKSLEHKLFADGYKQIIAIDEVGVGCLAGPVVVCAIAFSRTFFQTPHLKLNSVRDSKLLSSAQRQRLAAELLKVASIKYKICYCRPATIDRINIYQATRTAMRRAIRKLTTTSSKLKTIILVDGPHKIIGTTLPQLAITKGDRRVVPNPPARPCLRRTASARQDRGVPAGRS